ncbi:TonB-dependent receptor [Lysobacter gummosus]|uniref:TonB-dependent receptor n=1 Tax=Lysobacter gummosus TaxID=262324 RepID=A0ABY3XGM8_9GAMM|nr:TonB-dependent receptor [Lysobacter gummosus]ALN90224.1 tonB dependent receptor family protein [Lysobacter gummosus]UNP30774.1 TonB-dependent receptor [Lysobacter gummosus]
MKTPTRTPLALALLAVLPLVCQAQTPSTPADAGVRNASTAAVVAGGAPLETAATLDTISVIGHREVRQVQHIGKVELQASALGTNPVKVLEKLPGVHFVSSDPWGSYEWSNRIAIRGFAQNQLGYTLDDLPLGDNSYANNNGLSPNRAILPENIAQLELAQGSGALRIPSTSNLGGALLLHSSDPESEFGARVNLAYGDNATLRSFVRVDTGDHGGFSAYVSGMHSQADRWKGAGVQEQQQFNGKAVYQWDRGRVAAWLSTSRRNETDDQDMSLDLIRRCGYDWDNYAPDWQRALAAAKGQFSGCMKTKDDAYYLARGMRNDDLASVSGEFDLNDQLRLNATAYYHRNEGQGHWFTPYISSPTIPMALRITSYDIERSGLNARLAYTLDQHTLEGGFWFEDSVHGAGRSFVNIAGPIDDQRFFDPSEFAQRLFRQRFDTRTRQWFLQDTMRLLDERLTINAGFKGQDVVTDGTVVVPGRAGGRLSTRDNFLPQLGLSWKLNEQSDVFANYAENQAAFRPGVNGAWSLTQASFDLSRASAKPEESKTLELGWRYGDDRYQLSTTLYGVNFDNRQLVIVPCPGVVSCPNQFANVGKVRTLGGEFAFVWTPTEHLRWLTSYAYNDSQYRSNYLSSGKLVQVRGKQVVDTPKQLFATEISYGAGDFELRLGGKYTGKRYYTYTNDAGTDAFWLWDAGVSWQRKDVGQIKSLRVGLNVYNLLDKTYIATLGSNGFRDTDPQGTFQTLLTGAPRQWFVSVDAKF